jgi:heptosyltransferase I
MNILLIRLRMIGDVVFTTPAIRALRRRYPDARISYLVEDAAAPVVQGNPHLDDVLVIPLTTGLGRIGDDWRIGADLRRRRFDLVIDFHGGPRGSWLSWLTRAPQRIGYTVPGRSWMYTQAVARPRQLRPRHSVENQWDLLAALGIDAPERTSDPVEMPEREDVRARVDGRLQSNGIGSEAPVVVMHVSAGNPFRRWPVDRFAAVAARLVQDDPSRFVVLTSGPSDAGAADEAAREAQQQLPSGLASRIARCGEFDLPELRALVGRAALYIGGDSGPLHIAATTSVPVVGLYGPTLPVRSAPWRSGLLVAESVDAGELPCRPCDQRVCAPGDFRCLTWITPDQVVAAARRATTDRDSARLPTRSR